MRSTAAEVAGDRRRIVFVDLVRLLASVQMLHGHSLDAVMAEDLRHGAIFDAWSSMRGLVSVGFLFAAGLSYHLSTLTSFERHRSSSAKKIRRVRRALWLIALGYLLHYPEAIFSGDADAVAFSLHEFAKVDVLQCIGLSMLALEALTHFMRSARQVVLASGVLAILLFALAPLGDRVDPSGGFRPLINYLTHGGGSIFPLLPWAGYVFIGVVAGEVVLPRGVDTAPDLRLRRLAMLSIASLALAALVELSPLSFVAGETHRNAEPAFTLWKLAVALCVVMLLELAARRIRTLPNALCILAGESLILYLAHLYVLYGVGIGIHRYVGHTLSLGPAMLVATAMVPFVALIGLGWHRLKAWRADTTVSNRIGGNAGAAGS